MKSSDSSSINRVRRLVAVLFPLGMALVFLQALIFPTQRAEWIYSGAFLIFLFEFLAVFAAVVPYRLRARLQHSRASLFSRLYVSQSELIMLFIVCALAILVAVALDGPIILLFFFLSLFQKLFSSKRTESAEVDWIVPALLYILTIFVVSSISSEFIASLFPLPDSVIAQRPVNQGGTFTDTPQLILTWGILYFSLMTLYQCFKVSVDAFLMREKRTTLTSGV